MQIYPLYEVPWLSSLKLALSNAELDSLNKGNTKRIQVTHCVDSSSEDLPLRKTDGKGDPPVEGKRKWSGGFDQHQLGVRAEIRAALFNI